MIVHLKANHGLETSKLSTIFGVAYARKDLKQKENLKIMRVYPTQMVANIVKMSTFLRFLWNIMLGKTMWS